MNKPTEFDDYYEWTIGKHGDWWLCVTWWKTGKLDIIEISDDSENEKNIFTKKIQTLEDAQILADLTKNLCGKYIVLEF